MMVGIAIMLFLFFTGEYIDIKIVKEDYEEYGKAVDLMHAIATSSDIIAKNSDGLKLKLVLDKNALLAEESKKREIDGYYYLSYDYSLKIDDFKTGETWLLGFPEETLNNFIKNERKCIEKDERILASKSIPVIIKNDISKNSGQLKIKLTKTPLSQLAYYISLSCMMPGSESDKFQKIILAYGLDSPQDNIKITKLDEKSYDVCVKTEDSIQLCKKISCSVEIVQETYTGNSNTDCPEFIIKNTGGKVVVYKPQSA